MLSHGRIRAAQEPHALGGDTIERPAGIRKITTFKNEPNNKPVDPRKSGSQLPNSAHFRSRCEIKVPG